MDPNVMAILEKAKATAIYAAEQAGKAAGVASKKASDVATLTRQNLQIFDLNSDIDSIYKEIGKIVYLAHTGDVQPSNQLEDLLVQIDEKLAKVAEIKESLNKAKVSHECPNCGVEADREALFCSNCGRRLK